MNTLDMAIKVLDDDRDRKSLERIKSMSKNIMKSGDVLHDFIDMKNTAKQIGDRKLNAEADKIVNEIAGKLRRMF